MNTVETLPENHIDHTRGMTPREFARRYRVSHDRVRAMILRGELPALNMAITRSGRPRFVILPEHLVEFQRRRLAATAPSPVQRVKRRQPNEVDYFPDN